MYTLCCSDTTDASIACKFAASFEELSLVLNLGSTIVIIVVVKSLLVIELVLHCSPSSSSHLLKTGLSCLIG